MAGVRALAFVSTFLSTPRTPLLMLVVVEVVEYSRNKVPVLLLYFP